MPEPVVLDRTESDLLQSMAEELVARDLYIERGKSAGAAGDQKTVALYKEIGGDENEHYHLFKNRLTEKTGGRGMTEEDMDKIANKVASRVLEEVVPAILEPERQELLAHFTEHAMTGHALVVDEAAVKTSPCRCFSYKGRDYCFAHHGAIGMLTAEQQAELCHAGKNFNVGAGLKTRFEKFAEAAEEAHKAIEGVPKGERLEPWLRSMSKELTARKVTL